VSTTPKNLIITVIVNCAEGKTLFACGAWDGGSEHRLSIRINMEFALASMLWLRSTCLLVMTQSIDIDVLLITNHQ
jgi:hypothetical protein